MIQVIKSCLPQPPTSTYQRFIWQDPRNTDSRRCKPSRSSAMSTAFSVRGQKLWCEEGTGKRVQGHCLCVGRELAEMSHSLFLDWEREEGWNRRSVIGQRQCHVHFRPLPQKDYNRVQVSFPRSLKEGRERSSDAVKLFSRSKRKEVSPFPIVVLDCSDTHGVTGNTCCILNSLHALIWMSF